MNKLNFNKDLFKIFYDSYKKHEFNPSKYWTQYVDMILHEIDKDGLNGFGNVYNLTRGFGDAMSYGKRKKIRSLLRFKFLYKPVEKFLADRKQKKNSKEVFKASQYFFTQNDLINKISFELNEVTKNLGINRYNEIYKNKVPWRYLQGFVYIELLTIISKNDANGISMKDIFDGNTMDIGGGYGPVIDIFYTYKNQNLIGNGSINYQLEQFPVSFIANQYLNYRHKGKVLKPILNANFDYENQEHLNQSFRILQSSVSNLVKGLNIKFFFNSNSFQEMDKEQVEEYVRFMKDNSAETSFLGSFYYNTGAGDAKKSQVWNSEKGSIHASIDLFNREFKPIDKIDFAMHGYVPGTLFLYELKK